MSAVSAKTADPSMEEILASIRRIIADDDDKGPEPATAIDGSKEASRLPEPAGEPPASPDRGDEDHDILDLAGIDARPGSDASLDIDLPDLSFAPAPEPEWPGQADSAPKPAHETPEPVRPMLAPEPVKPPVAPLAAAVAQSSAGSRAAPHSGPAPENARDVSRSAAEPPRPPRSAIAPPSPAVSAEAIISREATASVGQAFHLLSHTIMSQHATTLEDIVREMLKPMLKTWLDDNLPPLVERLVAAEIQRVARGQR